MFVTNLPGAGKLARLVSEVNVLLYVRHAPIQDESERR